MADGFWGGGDRERTLSIMKDPTVGSFGALALLSLMLLKWVAILRLTEHGAFASLPLVCCLVGCRRCCWPHRFRMPGRKGERLQVLSGVLAELMQQWPWLSR